MLQSLRVGKPSMVEVSVYVVLSNMGAGKVVVPIPLLSITQLGTPVNSAAGEVEAAGSRGSRKGEI